MSIQGSEKLKSGHATCAGCLMPSIVRTVLGATDDPIVVSAATGCLEVTTTIYPNSSWNVPFIHSAFENVAATISGIETAARALKKRGLIPNKQKIRFVAFAGDGGTYDIGLQALSGALERGHDFLYVCYDNGAYMNTGNQRSGATPLGADTETTPAGKRTIGKEERRKDIMAIVAAHQVPYAATANIGYPADFLAKVKKAYSFEGPKFILVFSPCVNQWKYPTQDGLSIAQLATESNFWPLYEIQEGKYRITYEPKKAQPIQSFYQTQGRFRHLFGKKDTKKILKFIQNDVDHQWKRLKNMEQCTMEA